MPPWLIWLSWTSLALAVACALVILIDILAGHRQKMGVMNVVWPITALYAGPLALWAYFAVGRSSGESKEKPFWQSVGLAATHCGAGCTLGDLCAESLMAYAPLVLFGHEIFGAWVVDFLFAFAFGIAFQYFTIAPMRHLSLGAGLGAALKADTLSLASWQVGMYGWMAIAVFGIFGHPLDKAGPVFWFMMQLAMLLGFVTAYPVNWWLLRAGVKEKM